MKKQILTFLIGFNVLINLSSQTKVAQNTLSHADKQFFIENKGQWPDEVLYLTRIDGLDAWITKNGVLYDFYKLEEVQNSSKIESSLPDKFGHEDYSKIGHKVWYKLKGKNLHFETEGKEKLAGYYNYLIGNNPSKHASNVSLYKEALLKNVYNGIDIHYYFDKGNIRYDYVVHPGADPSQITFALEGTDKTCLNPQGDLVFNTRFGEVALAELHTYQGTKTNKISSRFVKSGNDWHIAVGNYNMNQTMIIDPLIYSTYLGGSSWDYGTSIVLDASGNAYVTGYTFSSNFDITTGVYQTSLAGSADIFVTKLNATGNSLIYSTYMGGSDGDFGFSIAIDASGNAYVAGISYGSFNITSGAFQTTYAGGYSDIVVTKLNAKGTGLIYSTYIGGSSEDRAYAIAIDVSGNAYITGYTGSTNYDIISGAYQSSYEGGIVDVFVTKLNANGSALVYSTYLGGSDGDFGRSIAIDASGNAYVTGNTYSSNYDTTAGAYKTSYRNAFVTKLNANGTALVYSTYLGGNNGDVRGFAIAIDTSGNAYVTGYTASTNCDTTAGAYKTRYAGGTYDAFVAKLNATGKALVYFTYLGGNDWDIGRAIVIDASGNAFVAGETKSTNFDTTSGAYQTHNTGGAYDAFVTKLNATGTALTYSTYLGGNGDDYGYSIALNTSGNVYVTGYTGSTDYDTTFGAFQTNIAGSIDAFVTRICFVAKASISLSSGVGTDAQNICINNAITAIEYATKNASGATVAGLPAGVTGSFGANTFTISGTPIASGTFPYTVILTGGCGTEIAKGSIFVNPDNTIRLPATSGRDSQSVCINTPITQIRYLTTFATGATVTGLPAGVTSSFAANAVTISGIPNATDTFNTVILTGGCGTVIAKGRIIVNPENTIGLSSSVGTDSQRVCIHNAINNITYTTTDATGATVTGLPAGVTGSFAANVLTISGTPTVSDTFNYIVILIGGCGTTAANGSIIVMPDNTIGLSSASGTDKQSVCIHTPIISITYATTDATGAIFTGLPVGVTGSFSANVVTISGTPSASDTFNYIVTLTGGCGTTAAKGKITVNPDNTMSLSSTLGTDSQSVCINNAISKIMYATKYATGATVTGLPAGITGNFAANLVTISGVPSASGIFPYTVTLAGGCGTITVKGNIAVNPDNTIGLSSASGTDVQNVKVNTAITNITYATTNATGATITGLPSGVTASFGSNNITIGGIPSVKGIFPYTVALTGGCGNITSAGRITVGDLGITHTKLKALQPFPNPANTEVNIKGVFTSLAQIEIIDALGRINQADYSLDNNTIRLKVSSLDNGVYCISILDNGQFFQYNIIVQH